MLKEEECVGESRVYPYHTTLFQAQVLGSLIDQNTYAVRAYWSDITHDHRGAFVRYALLVPAQEGDIIQTLARTPLLLLDCFKAAYPGFDNSARHGLQLQKISAKLKISILRCGAVGADFLVDNVSCLR